MTSELADTSTSAGNILRALVNAGLVTSEGKFRPEYVADPAFFELAEKTISLLMRLRSGAQFQAVQLPSQRTGSSTASPPSVGEWRDRSKYLDSKGAHLVALGFYASRNKTYEAAVFGDLVEQLEGDEIRAVNVTKRLKYDGFIVDPLQGPASTSHPNKATFEITATGRSFWKQAVADIDACVKSTHESTTLRILLARNAGVRRDYSLPDAGAFSRPPLVL